MKLFCSSYLHLLFSINPLYVNRNQKEIERLNSKSSNGIQENFMYLCLKIVVSGYTTRNTLTQASKNGHKPYLFPQKKFV